MKTVISGCLIFALAAAASAHAHADAMSAGYLGSPADGTPFARHIDVRPATKWINVRQDETVALMNDEGRTFVWKFDTAENVVPLALVAPPGFLHGRPLDAYVMRPPASD